ncbi:MAG: DUF4202 domain-containing protein [Marivirga sp.]|nr:DUF4202 domain-containing protein [Marivirga sp.]
MLDNPFDTAISRFDDYNSNDTHHEQFEGKTYTKEVLYARRMSEWLDVFAPGSPEYLRLAARCQHIGRWEIPRDSYPMDRKGYLQWRSTLKIHHAKIAGQILADCGYGDEIIDKVKFLLLKKELNRNPDTQLLEDVICLVFIQYYLDEFAAKHDDNKVVDILQKTMKKMSDKAISEAGKIAVSGKIAALIQKAADS